MSITEEQAEELQRRVEANATKRTYASVEEATAARGALITSSPYRYAINGPHVIIHIDPIGAPRQSRRDAWDPSRRVVRYRAWKDRFVPACKAAGWSLGSELHAEFEIAMPDSWSKKKKAAHLGALHHQRPDIDNICKAVMDSFGLEDGHVASLRVMKRWAEKGRIILYR